MRGRFWTDVKVVDAKIAVLVYSVYGDSVRARISANNYEPSRKRNVYLLFARLDESGCLSRQFWMLDPFPTKNIAGSSYSFGNILVKTVQTLKFRKKKPEKKCNHRIEGIFLLLKSFTSVL